MHALVLDHLGVELAIALFEVIVVVAKVVVGELVEEDLADVEEGARAGEVVGEEAEADLQVGKVNIEAVSQTDFG